MNDSTLESYSAVLEKRLMKIRVATRGSALALKQTDIAIEYLKEYLEDVSFEKVIINTHGDKDQKTALYNLNTNGVFMKEVEKALLPENAQEGDCLIFENGKYTLNKEKSAKLKEDIDNLMDELFD